MVPFGFWEMPHFSPEVYPHTFAISMGFKTPNCLKHFSIKAIAGRQTFDYYHYLKVQITTFRRNCNLNKMNMKSMFSL